MWIIASYEIKHAKYQDAIPNMALWSRIRKNHGRAFEKCNENIGTLSLFKAKDYVFFIFIFSIPNTVPGDLMGAQ